MLQAIGTGCGCADDRFLKTSLCSALHIIHNIWISPLQSALWKMKPPISEDFDKCSNEHKRAVGSFSK